MKKNITNIVEKLASHESYKDLYHEHRYGVPLPSNEVLLQITIRCLIMYQHILMVHDRLINMLKTMMKRYDMPPMLI